MDRRYGVPRILAFEHRRRRFGVFVADAIGGMQAIELVLEQSRQHAEILERLQWEAALSIPNTNVKSATFIDEDIEPDR